MIGVSDGIDVPSRYRTPPALGSERGVGQNRRFLERCAEVAFDVGSDVASDVGGASGERRRVPITAAPSAVPPSRADRHDW
jgi:hypothetical protein